MIFHTVYTDVLFKLKYDSEIIYLVSLPKIGLMC